MSQETKDRSHLPAWVSELDRPGSDAGGQVTVTFPDESEPLTVSRREFMRVASVAAATAGITAACRTAEEAIVPYVRRRDGVYHDRPLSFMSVCDGCPTQCGTSLTVREGRVVKLEGNPHHPINRGSLCARGQASVISVYSPDRVMKPLQMAGEAEPVESTWEALDGAVAGALKGAGKVRVLVGHRTGAAQLAALDAFLSSFGDGKAVLYQPLAPEGSRQASAMVYGRSGGVNYRLDRAQAVVSIGGAFLDVDGPVGQLTRGWAQTRDPDGSMSRLHVFESRMTLTGAAADRRTPVKASELVHVALGIAHELIVAGGLSSYKDDAGVKGALEPFAADKVASALGIEASALKEAAADLRAAGARGVVMVGGAGAGEHDVALHGVAALINEALGNAGVTVEPHLATWQSGVDFDPALGGKNIQGGFAAFQALLKELPTVDVLIVSGVNPVYDAPPALKVAEAFGKAKLVVVVDTEVTETARAGAWLAPLSHFLESWGDAQPGQGLHALRQPGLMPLHGSRSLEDALILWGVAAGGKLAQAGPFKAAVDAHGAFVDPMKRPSPGPFYFFLREFWRAGVYSASRSPSTFEKFWEGVLREGVCYTGVGGGSAMATRALWSSPRAGGGAAGRTKPSFDEVLKRAPKAPRGSSGELVVELFPTIGHGDGRFASNGVLQELFDPVMQVTWGNYAALSPAHFTELKLLPGQVIEVGTEAGTLRLPAMLMPGLQRDTIAIPLGYGRTSAGITGTGIGGNGFTLAGVGAEGPVYTGLAATVTVTSEREMIGQPQGKGHVIDLHDRPIVPLTTLAAYKADPESGQHEHHEVTFWGNANAFPKEEVPWGQDHFYEKSKWEMAIDLNRCTGCGACVVACQVENNIPVVGKTGVNEGRAMHWLRIDRYFKLPERDDHGNWDKEMLTQHPEVAAAAHLENPVVLVEPMLCQHCSNAPCESVCPVLATVHSDDGLNEQVYNRCVGTRYCANNCPFKVRRFNWYNYTDDRSEEIFATVFPQLKDHAQYNVKWPLPLKFNPEVTVRARGVMEKCSFCVQRLRRGTYTARKLGIADKPEAIKTACQQTCPAEAITFGDIRLPGGEIVKKVSHARAFTLLSHLAVQPAVKYLTRVRNVQG